MRALHLVLLSVLAAHTTAAQDANVYGEVIFKESGQPLGFTTVSILSQGTQLLTAESGKFLLRNLPPGLVKLRFKRIGFVPKDTTLSVAANDTARIRIEMRRLVIQLPAMIVSGKCTNQAPFEAKPAILEELFDQVNQNAERVQLLAEAKPFLIYIHRVNGYRKDNRVVPTEIDTVVRRPLPPGPYVPMDVIHRGRGGDADDWVMALPELPNFADTSFTNNHCFRYAGQTRIEQDSVIKVEFEPVPWLDKQVDIKGTMFLRVGDYQLLSTITSLNRIPSQFRNSGLQDVTVRARFSEIVSGVPILDEWELTRRFRYPTPPRVEVGQVFRVEWTDSTAAKIDTLARRR